MTATWLVLFEKIWRDDRPTAELLSFMSRIKPRAIPESLLPMQETEEELVHAVGTQKGYAFLQEREDVGFFVWRREAGSTEKGRPSKSG